MSNLDDLTKKISELLGDAVHATSNILPQAWKLLVDYQRATALASLIGSACGIISSCILFITCNRLIKSATSFYKKRVDDKAHDPAESAGVIVPMAASIVLFVGACCIMSDALRILPIAIAKHYYPDAFAAQQLMESATK